MLEEARAVELDERLASGERGRHDAPLAARRRDGGRARRLGWAEAGRIEPGALADLVTIGLDGVRLAGATAGDRARGRGVRRRRRDVERVVCGGREIVRDGRHVGLDVAGRAARGDRGGDVDDAPRRSTGSACSSPTTPELGEGPLGIVRDAALVIEDGRVAAIERSGAAADERFDAARALRDPRLRRQPHPPRLRRRPRRGVRGPDGGPGVRGGRDPGHDGGDPRGRARRSCSPSRAARRAEGIAAGITEVEVKSGYGLDVESEERLCRVAAELTDEVTFLGGHLLPPEYEGRADEYVELVCGPMLAACRPYARWIGRLLRAGRLRRRPVAGDAGRRPRGRARAARARQPARPGPGGAARRRARRRLGRSLHLPLRRRHRGARGQRDRRHVPAGDRLLDPPALSRRPPGDRRRGRRSRSPPTPTRARATRPRCRSASRSPSATWG